MAKNTKIGIIFHRLGPYHIARLLALSKTYKVVAIELSKTTSEYLWDEVDTPSAIERITLFKEQDSKQVSSSYLKKRLYNVLNSTKVNAVFVNGWSDRGALLATLWCTKYNVPAFVMSATTAFDFKRYWWKEFIKRKVVANFSGALVGGKPHAQYIRQLGIKHGPIAAGYDVVDNDHFEKGAAEAKSKDNFYRKKYGLPVNYFLTSNRFMEKKNLFRLLEAYHQYRQQSSKPYDLVLLGDGELKQRIRDTISNLDLQDFVHLPGFKQYHELPIYYGLAKAFVQASTSEQWGLVINEAMASGLPVIVSKNCGCAVDLVKHGTNGYTFDPYDISELANYMFKLTEDDNLRDKMGVQSTKIIENFSPDTFRKGVTELVKAIGTAKPSVNQKDKLVGQFVLHLLIKIY